MWLWLPRSVDLRALCHALMLWIKDRINFRSIPNLPSFLLLSPRSPTSHLSFGCVSQGSNWFHAIGYTDYSRSPLFSSHAISGSSDRVLLKLWGFRGYLNIKSGEYEFLFIIVVLLFLDPRGQKTFNRITSLYMYRYIWTRFNSNRHSCSCSCCCCRCSSLTANHYSPPTHRKISVPRGLN